MEEINLITVSQAKALGSRMVEVIPTDLTEDQATYLLEHHALIGEALVAAIQSLVGGSNATKEVEERLSLVVTKMRKVLPEVLRMDNPGLTTEHSRIHVGRLTDLLAFVSGFVSGREVVSFPNFEMDLTVFGYKSFGKLDEVKPESFSELRLVSCKDYLLNPKSSKACGQATAEWIAKNNGQIPEDWRSTKDGKILSFPGSGWCHEYYGNRMFCVCTKVYTPFPRIWADSGCPEPRSDTSVVCHR